MSTEKIITSEEKQALFAEAFALLKRAQEILDGLRIKHEAYCIKNGIAFKEFVDC
jgi:hypothetical protein